MSSAVASAYRTATNAEDVQPNALSQNIWLQIKNRLGGDSKINIKNAQLKWGKFLKYASGWDNEIEAQEVEKEVATSSQNARINACGRESASSGTEGYIDLYDGSTKIATIYWDCPWGASNNKLSKLGENSNYMVNIPSYNDTSHGTIGEVTITVFKF